MYKIGLSTNAVTKGVENGDMFREMIKAGVEAVELSYNMPESAQLDYKKIERAARETGMELWSYHLPFAPFEEIDISSRDEKMRISSVELNKELIRRVADIGVDKFVIHPSAEPIPDDEREAALEASGRSLSELADFAAERGAVIAVEDLPRTCLGNSAEDMLKLLSANDKLRVCFDTNHLLKDNNANFMDKVGDKIITIHVSDYDFINERHWLPGEGKLDWNMMVDGLKKIGYSGVWMYEINVITPKSIVRDRNLNYKDFIDNANAVLNYKKPPFGGTPIPNLGMWV